MRHPKELTFVLGLTLSLQTAIASHDVGVTRIIAPATTVTAGLSIVPACSVYNYGTFMESTYTVRMKIGNSYNDTATVLNHVPGSFRLVTFPPWVAGPLGSSTVTCSTRLALDSVPANNRLTRPTYVWSWPFGQIYVKTTMQGVLNGESISGTGSGMIDTTALFPSALWTYYPGDTPIVGFPPFLTMLPGPLEAESGAVNLWQMTGGDLNCVQTYTWPSHPVDTVGVSFYSVLVGCTLQVGIGLLGQISVPDDTPLWSHVAHWTQLDSNTVSELCTLRYITFEGDTPIITRASTYSGTRRRLPGPEVSKTYFPFVTDSNQLSSVSWCGRTMPENHGRQMDMRGKIEGTVNGQPLSAKLWAMVDTTGEKPGYAYALFDSTPVPPEGLVWFDSDVGEAGYVAPTPPRALNLWALTGGDLNASRTAVFPQSPSDTFTSLTSARRSGTNVDFTVQVSGKYSGPQNLARLKSECARWHQEDSTTMTVQGTASVLMDNGDSVVANVAVTYRDLIRQLNFDETVSVSFPQCRSANGFLGFTWHGTADSATSAVAEPRPGTTSSVRRLQIAPNPLSGSAIITYSLPKPGIASLKLYDVAGRCISVLQAGQAPASEYSTRFDAGKLSRGVYLLKLDADGGSVVRKTVVQ